MPLSILNKFEAWAIGIGCGLLAVGTIGLILFLHHYRDRFYPGVYVDAVHVGGLTLAEARDQMPQTTLPDGVLTLQVDDISVASSSAELGLHRDYDQALTAAFAAGREGALPDRLITIADLHFRPTYFLSGVAFNPAQTQAMIAELARAVDAAPTPSSAQLKTSGVASSLTLDPGTAGRELELERTQELVLASALTPNTTLEAPVASVGSQLNPEQVAIARERASALVGKKIILHSSDSTLQLSDQTLIGFLTFPDGISQEKLQAAMSGWKTSIERPPQNAEFDYDRDTKAVTRFVPARDGLTLKPEETLTAVTQALAQLETTDEASKNVDLALTITPPTVTLADTNDLGINELLGFGESEYDHSIPTRIHNVALTTEKITNYLVAPGAEFSFNEALGDVSAATGFQPAYVIKNGQTMLGDGGGVCQVSTTLFRAVLDAGLPITKRRAHSYRVSYYELDSKPGVDATVYSGDIDLRFVNDTGHYILIHAEADSKNLVMDVEIYGTSDGRSAEIVDHVTWDFRPAPPPVYIPDPSLAPGQTKQIDFAASGIRARFTNVVKDRDGNIIREDTYTSNYIPWSAKYLQGV